MSNYYPNRDMLWSGFPTNWTLLKRLMWVRIMRGGSVSPVYETITGNPVSFETVRPYKLRQLSVAFSPVQNLNGYDSPWPAGGGKNLSHLYDADLGHGSIVKDQTDNAVTVYNITENASYKYASYKALDLTGLGGQTLAFSCKATVIAGDDTPRVIGAFWTESGRIGSNLFEKTGTPLQATVTVPSDIPDGAWLRLTFYSSSNRAGAQEIKYYNIQVEAGSTATSYAPYANECPISGWSSLTVEQRGVNMWDEEWELGALNSTTGQDQSDSTHIRSKNYIPVAPSTAYYNKGYTLAIFEYDANKAYLGYHNYIVGTFTTSASTRYLRFYRTATTYSNDISINYPSTDHDYHAYNPSSRSISISLGETVYSGYVDVVTGVLTVDHYLVVVDETLPFSNWAAPTTPWVGIAVGTGNTSLPQMKAGRQNGLPSNMLKSVDYNTSSWNVYGVNGNLYICLNENALGGRTDEYIKPWLANNNIQIIYPLATPIPIQLTPQEVESLAGDNTLWSDANQPLTVTYRSN